MTHAFWSWSGQYRRRTPYAWSPSAAKIESSYLNLNELSSGAIVVVVANGSDCDNSVGGDCDVGDDDNNDAV